MRPRECTGVRATADRPSGVSQVLSLASLSSSRPCFPSRGVYVFAKAKDSPGTRPGKSQRWPNYSGSSHILDMFKITLAQAPALVRGMPRQRQCSLLLEGWLSSPPQPSRPPQLPALSEAERQKGQKFGQCGRLQSQYKKRCFPSRRFPRAGAQEEAPRHNRSPRSPERKHSRKVPIQALHLAERIPRRESPDSQGKACVALWRAPGNSGRLAALP